MDGSSWVLYLRQAARGDQEAFAAFYDASASLAYGIALRLLGNQADAEDTVIDAYLQMWRTAASFDCDRGNPAAWVATIVRSRALDRIRQRSRRRSEDDQALSRMAASGPTPADSCEIKQEAGKIRSALERLPEAYRRVLELAYFNGMSHSQIAARLNEPLGTVKTRTRRALDLMREAMAACGVRGWSAAG